MSNIPWRERLWLIATRVPNPGDPRWALVVSIVLLVVAWQLNQFQTTYLIQHSYSAESKTLAAVSLAPLWEESLKVGIGVFVGAVFLFDVRVFRRRRALRASVVVFLVVAASFIIDESLGGGVDGTVATPVGVFLKILGHPFFSLLAVPLGLEAKPRAAVFIGLGYGSHSLLNFIVNFLPVGFVRSVAYLSVLFLIVGFDTRLLLMWYRPPSGDAGTAM